MDETLIGNNVVEDAVTKFVVAFVDVFKSVVDNSVTLALIVGLEPISPDVGSGCDVTLPIVDVDAFTDGRLTVKAVEELKD